MILGPRPGTVLGKIPGEIRDVFPELTCLANDQMLIVRADFF